ncbi:hypothetical protein HK096_002177, partial [Nowakowskiella sp. JEL0078]
MGVILRLANVGEQILVEKDWIVVIASQSELSSLLRQVDLICKLGAPFAVSLLASFVSGGMTMLCVAGWSLLCMPVEIGLAIRTYNVVPDLHHRGQPNSSVSENSETLISESHHPQAKKYVSSVILNFMKHPVFLPSLALSVLYFTTISFSGVMIAFLLTKGFNVAWVAITRGLAVVAGLLGTVLAPIAIKKIGLARSGSWAVWTQTMCLIPAVIALWMWHYSKSNDSTLFGIVFVVAVITSRMFLWMFDLSVTQILQL